MTTAVTLFTLEKCGETEPSGGSDRTGSNPWFFFSDFNMKSSDVPSCSGSSCFSTIIQGSGLPSGLTRSSTETTPLVLDRGDKGETSNLAVGGGGVASLGERHTNTTVGVQGVPTKPLCLMDSLMDCINVVQINLHHSRSASAILSKRLASGATDIALIQEPWTHNSKIMGLGIKGYNVFYDTSCIRPRACIVVSNKLNALNLVNYLDGDNVAIKVNYDINGHKDEFIFMSAYLPYEEKDPLTNVTKDLIEHCKMNKKFIIGCDANAHHTVWGSSDCNRRGDDLLNYILFYNLFILNNNSKPTFVTVNRSEVIDLTICNNIAYDSIIKWNVSDDITLSDHLLIMFSVKGLSRHVTEGRNPKSTNWVSYKEDLHAKTVGQFGKLSSIADLDLAVDQLQQSIIQSYYQNCKATKADSPRLVPWWSKELSFLRSKCRKLFNRAKKSGDWLSYKTALTSYNKAVRDAKRNSWRKYCDGIRHSSATAKLVNIMSKDRNCSLNTIKLPNGKFSESGKGALAELFRVHFPVSEPYYHNAIPIACPTPICDSGKWSIARKVVTPDRVNWAINSFKPYKSPGIDGIIPILLKEGIHVLSPILCKIYRACIAFGHVPTAWRHTKVIFIPKIGKDNYYEAKSFRPISLTSFLLKAIEKLIDRHIREVVLASMPLSISQHAYQPGRSTDTALYSLSFLLERNLNAKEIALAVFLDIEGAFDKVPIDTILHSLDRRGVDMTISYWIRNLLSTRYICASLLGDSMTVHALAGCPQGGVLSPLLWCFAVDSLLENITSSGLSCIGYADDVVIIARGKFGNTVSDVMSGALRGVETWCNNAGLSVNPLKTTMVAFTKKRILNLKDICFFGQKLTCSKEVKFLGIYFDMGLNWKRHFDYCVTKARRIFWSCRNAIGRTWGLNPRAIHWIYSMVVCPIITYGSIIWWSRIRCDNAKSDLIRLQRMVCIAISGCMKTTPTATLELLLGLHPLYMQIEAEALISLKRLKNLGHWKDYSNYLSWSGLNPIAMSHSYIHMPSDGILVRYAFDKPYKIQVPSRDDWRKTPTYNKSNCAVWYTDGSKLGSSTGAGVCCPDDGTRYSYPLGSYTTVFQAEVYAILMCCRICSDRDYRSGCIYICSDSQAALMALEKTTMTSSLVWECYIALCNIASNNRVILYWVPGHSGIPGNEMADELARNGSNTPFVGPEPAVGVSAELIRSTIYGIFRKLQCKNWRDIKGQRQAKELNRGCPSARHKELFRLNKTGIRRVVGLLTGHCTLKRHLSIMGVIKDPVCRGCGYNDETATHILCECEAFSAHRFEHLGRHVIEPWELQDIPVKCLLIFASATGLFV